jgi:hypothetical protein
MWKTLRSTISALAIPADAVEVRSGGGGTLTHTSRNAGLPYEGGLRVVVYPNGYPQLAVACTTSFTVRRADNNLFRGLTAGHCDNYNPNDGWMGTPLVRVGAVATNSYYASNPTNSDAVRIEIPQNQATARIFVGTGHRTVKSPRYVAGDLKSGVNLCFQGIASDNNNCGNINRVDIAVTDTRGVVHNHTWSINFDAFPGDSGGPVYGVRTDGNAKPAGMVWGQHNPSNDMLFHAIGYVMQDVNVNLYYG